MEEATIKQTKIKWQLILGAIFCAFIAFCILPGSVVAVETKAPITYIERAWDPDAKILKEEEKQCLDYYKLTEDMCADEEGIGTGWYVLDGKITYTGKKPISIKGGAEVHLILRDDCKLKATQHAAIQISEGSSLTIYEEGGETGKETGSIVVDGKTGYAGIGVEAGSALQIKGGTIEASGTEGGAGIGGNNGDNSGFINIFGGDITATGGFHGAGIGGGGSNKGKAGSCGIVTIFGGNVTATGSKKAAGIGSGGDPDTGTNDQGIIAILGGNVTAKGGSHAAGIGGGTENSGGMILIDLGIKENAGTINATGGSCGAGIGGGDDAGAGYILINKGTIKAMGGAEAPGIGGDSEANGEESGFITIKGGDITARKGKDAKYDIGNDDDVIDINLEINGGNLNDSTYPTSTKTPVKYIDREWTDDGHIKETTKECTNYLTLTETRCNYGLGYMRAETWYVLDKNINYNKKGRIVINGDVNLILKNGSQLDVTYNGYPQMGIYLANGATLSIYREEPTYISGNTSYAGQPVPEGIIIVDGGEGKAGIRVAKDSTLNIEGGRIEASGTRGGAGIGGDENEHAGTVNILGGEVDVKGGRKSAGIGGGGDYRGDTIGAGVGIAVGVVALIVAAVITGGLAGIAGSMVSFNTAIFFGGSLIELTLTQATVGAVVAAFSGIAVALPGIIGGSVVIAAEKNHGGDGGTTNIYGGTVTVEGGNDAPSIGGGWGKDVDGKAGTFNLLGGKVTGDLFSNANVSGGDINCDEIQSVEVSGGNIIANNIVKIKSVSGGNIKSKDYSYVYNDADKGADNDNTNEETDEDTDANNWMPHTFTIEGEEISDEVTVEDLDIYYGINDVHTIDTNKLYFCLSDQQYKQFNQLIIKDKEGTKYLCERYPNSNTFVLQPKKIVNVTGIKGQNVVYDGLPHPGYTGEPTNIEGFKGIYDITYYLANGEETTPKNSGAAGKGKMPVYAGEYSVRFAVPESNDDYYGYSEYIGFEIEQAAPTIVEAAAFSGAPGTFVKDMIYKGGVAKFGDKEVYGTWAVTDSRGSDLLEKKTTEEYEVTFYPESDNFKQVSIMVVPHIKEWLEIIGVSAKDGTYDGTLKLGYAGTPKNQQGYMGDYEITYYVYDNTTPASSESSQDKPSSTSKDGWKKTTPENSGAAEEGKAPVDSGYYRVKIAMPQTNWYFYGDIILDFKIEKATAKVEKQPTLSGVYGTAIKDMEITGGIVKAGDEEIEGTWEAIDSMASDIPEVGTKNSYELFFDGRNYTAITEVVPNIEKATPKIIGAPTFSGEYGKTLKDMALDTSSVNVVGVDGNEMQGLWKLTDSKASDIPEEGSHGPYEVTFIPNDTRNYNSVISMAVLNPMDKVDYIDRTWDEETKTVKEETRSCIGYEILTRDLLEGGLKGGNTPETAKWYILDTNIYMNEFGHVLGHYIPINGYVNIILKDNCTLDHDYGLVAIKGIILEDKANLTIYEEKQTYDNKGKPNPKGKIKVDGGSGNAGIRVPKGATLNIKGGEIEAYGTTGGAGIGGDEGESAGTIEILGGTVKAYGGNYGAGIGGGDEGAGGTVTIKGGKVTATGGKEAAGIGCGNEGNTAGETTITIDGGEVSGNGKKYAAGIGCGDGGGDGGGDKVDGSKVKVNITGGTLSVEGGKGAQNIGNGDNVEGCTPNITGGNIKGYSNHDITLEGVAEKIQVVGINADCTYGINDVYTFPYDASTLHFNMPDTEYAKLTEITIKYRDKTEQIYLKDKDNPHLFKPKPKTVVDITGVKAKNTTYNGSPQIGYTGTPANNNGYDGKYEITYSLSSGEKTTPENSGAEGEGNAPVYAGDYKVRIGVPSSDKKYAGSSELVFKIEKATPKTVEAPTLSGEYGTAVKDMKISGGVVKVGDVEVGGKWTLTDSRSSDVPNVGTKDKYEVTFTPNDTRNYNFVATMVVAKVIETPTSAGPAVSAL